MKKHFVFAGKVVAWQAVLLVIVIPIILVRWAMSEHSGQTHSSPTIFDSILQAGLFLLLAPVLLIHKILPEFFRADDEWMGVVGFALNFLLTALLALLSSLCFHEYKDSKAKDERDSQENAP